MSSELIKFKDKFLSFQENTTYQNHCNKFFNYLKKMDRINAPNNININDVIGSAKYYAELGKINTEASLFTHLEAIKAFYDFTFKSGIRTNIFNEITDYEEFKRQLVSDLSLKAKKSRDYIDLDTIIELLEYYDTVTFDDSKQMLIKFFVKLTLIAPAKRNVIANIKFNDFRNNFRSITLNDISVIIPNSLRKEIISYLSYLNKDYTNEKLFFEHIYDDQYNDNVFNTPLLNSLIAIEYDLAVNSTSTTYSVETIMNSAIYSMLKNNVNPSYISRINGVTVATIESKAKKWNVNSYSLDEIINNAIMKSSYFNYI